MFQISLDTANFLYVWGWRISLIAAAFTFVSLGALFIGTRVRDQDSEKQFSNLNLEASASRERAAKAELALAQLERRTGPRFIKTDEYIMALRQAKKFNLKIIYLRDNGEALGLAAQFYGVFHQLGWDVEFPQVAVRKSGTHEQIGTLLSYNAQPTGISMVFQEMPSDGDKNSARNILTPLLVRDFGSASTGINPQMTKNEMLLAIGPKP